MNTYTTSSVLNKLGGSLILNKTNVFSNDEIFNDGTSAASEILGFLNAGASLSSYLNDPTLNGGTPSSIPSYFVNGGSSSSSQTCYVSGGNV